MYGSVYIAYEMIHCSGTNATCSESGAFVMMEGERTFRHYYRRGGFVIVYSGRKYEARTNRLRGHKFQF